MSNNDRHQEIQEDGPEYRSVMMAPLSAPPMPRSFAAPPPRKFAVTRSAPVVQKAAPVSSQTASSTFKWTPEPTAIPVFHFLERTNVYVSNVSAQEVATRVTECCRKNNIAANTSTMSDLLDEDRNVLRCETEDCIKFAVRLFSDKDMLVVEVQRMCGCSYAFREVCRSILRAAKNESAATAPPPKKRTFKNPSTLPQRSVEDRQACVQSEFEHSLAMIQSERLDSQALGLESLESMTRTCGATDFLAKSVLKHDCLERLFFLLETAAKEDDSQTSRKVMAVLANTLNASGPAYLAEVLLSTSHLKAESFLAILLASLRDAAEKPHDACQAARCLQALLISSEVKEAILEMRLMEVLESACSTGCNIHMALEQESQKLMAQLRSC